MIHRRELKALVRGIQMALGRRAMPSDDPHLVMRPEDRDKFRSWSYLDIRDERRPKVLMASGFGYGNVGDEAQLGACIGRWKRACPDTTVTLLSPNPAYSAALHGERVEWASRVAWFRSNTTGPYFDDSRFPSFWKNLRRRLECSVRLYRGDLALSFCTAREMRIVELVREHDLVHISGGGFLTGKTRSRLWDFCLLMRVCQLLGKPYLLTGHNIGVFQDWNDRKIAAMGLKKALYIGLRDKGLSERELAEIGISGDHVVSTCDDALFCDRLGTETIRKSLVSQGGDPSKPWAAVNFHHWGQAEGSREGIESRFATICDEIVRQYGIQVVMIAMTPSDVEPERKVVSRMKEKGICFPYSPDYRMVRGIIADAAFVFTMKHHPIVFAQGESVPIVSVALDPYYLHKNKGAMENTGDGAFLADSKGFEGDCVLEQIRRVVDERESIRIRMRRWTDEMKDIELTPYQIALEELGG